MPKLVEKSAKKIRLDILRDRDLLSFLFKNSIYSYQNNNYMSLRSAFAYLKDIEYTDLRVIKKSKTSNIIIISDTDAAKIHDYAKFIHKSLGKNNSSLLLYVKHRDEYKNIKILSRIIITILCYLYENLLRPKSNEKLCEFGFHQLIYKAIHSSEILFENRRVITFYEKSILNSVASIFAESFEVVQHGVPTQTYWPSLADKYYSWGLPYQEEIARFFGGELRLLGYPGKVLTSISNTTNDTCPNPVDKKRYDVLFLSQIGSTQALADANLEISEYVSELSFQYKVIIKLHPRQKDARLFKNSAVVIAHKGERLEDLVAMSACVCSFNSTALLEAARLGARVLRVRPVKSLDFNPFPASLKIPEIGCDQSAINPVSEARKVDPEFSKFNGDVLND
jgi:hypothetical protein